MAVIEEELTLKEHAVNASPRRHVFSRRDFDRMGAAAILTDQRIELISGEIIDMSPIGNFHAAVTQPAGALLEKLFGPGFSARNQAPIALSESSEPQPDVAVVRGTWRDYATRQPEPSDIVLIVEFADSSLSFDRSMKEKLYSASGINEYWIVNLVDCRLEIYRDPTPEGYRTVTICDADSEVSPLHAPAARLLVAELLP